MVCGRLFCQDNQTVRRNNCARSRAYRDVAVRIRLVTEQFDDYVKRVRIFAYPALLWSCGRLANLPELLDQAITQTE